MKTWLRERFPEPYRIARRTYRRARHAGRSVGCPICGGRYRRWIIADGKWWNQVCPGCDSLPRQRLIWLWLRRETAFFRDRARVLHVAPEAQLQRRLRAMANLEYTSTDISSPLASVRADLTAAPWPDAMFDVIFCNHVLEHIPDDRRAMAELHRMMAPGGWGLALVPFRTDRETTEDPSITAPGDRLRAFGQEDHVRLYGKDYLERLAASGFDVEYGFYAAKLGVDVARHHGLQAEEFLIVIRKPFDPSAAPAGRCVRRWDGPAPGGLGPGGLGPEARAR